MREHLVVAHPLEGEATECDDFVKENAIGPNVRGWSEDSKTQRLWRHPSNR